MESYRLSSLGRNARTSRLIIFLLALGFAAVLAAGVTAFYVQRQNETDARQVAHTLAVEANLGSYANAMERLETARRGLILTQNPAFSQVMDEAEREARSQLASLAALIADNAEQRARVAELRAHLDI